MYATEEEKHNDRWQEQKGIICHDTQNRTQTRMCSLEVQIHTDSKDKVALGDITLWANRCTKCHGNTICRFHLILYYVSGDDFFTGKYSATRNVFRDNC